MTIKEHLHHSIDNMNVDELIVVYEHIQLLEQIKQRPTLSETSMPIAHILEMTRSSESCWSEAVRSEREERG